MKHKQRFILLLLAEFSPSIPFCLSMFLSITTIQITYRLTVPEEVVAQSVSVILGPSSTVVCPPI
jgi:hypothetical protein